MQTYTKRYALMNLFDIEDNKLDFDSQNNTPKAVEQSPAPQQAVQQQAQPATPPGEEKPWLNKWANKEQTKETPEWGKVLSALTAGKAVVADVEKKYKLSKEIKEELKAFEKKS
jgi:hypothetical protein